MIIIIAFIKQANQIQKKSKNNYWVHDLQTIVFNYMNTKSISTKKNQLVFIA